MVAEAMYQDVPIGVLIPRGWQMRPEHFGEALLEEEVAPGVGGDQIAEPLMDGFVTEKPVRLDCVPRTRRLK